MEKSRKCLCRIVILDHIGVTNVGDHDQETKLCIHLETVKNRLTSLFTIQYYLSSKIELLTVGLSQVASVGKMVVCNVGLIALALISNVGLIALTPSTFSLICCDSLWSANPNVQRAFTPYGDSLLLVYYEPQDVFARTSGI